MKRPTALGHLWHVALRVRDLAACEHFYVELLGMTVEWRPDADNVYLTSGRDNLALHRAELNDTPADIPAQTLDHIGFVLPTPAAVDVWHAYLQGHHVAIAQAPKTHRDGARSFYCRDPASNLVQLIYHPPLAAHSASA